MGLTPDKVIDKAALARRDRLNAIGAFVWLLALGAIFNGSGKGFIICIIIGVFFFWVASKIKVEWIKDAEVSRYS